MTPEQQKGQWNEDQLEYRTEESKNDAESPKRHTSSLKHFNLRRQGKEPPTVQEWGFPGELTHEQVEVYNKFRDEVNKRGGDFKQAVYSFGECEGEAFTLTRWLRARKYKYEDVITMVEEAVECRASAKADDFYPDGFQALGCDTAIYLAQFPQMYTGKAKTGCPLFISKPGVLQSDALECITTMEGILKFHWHVMVHDYGNRLRQYKEANPSFCRFESFCILDLAHLSMQQLTSTCLDIVKKQSFIDSLCFPETMNKMIIINAPRFFSLTWKVIKGWIDVRTANKVELYSSKSVATKRLLELVDKNELPSDYGGTGPTTDAIMAEQAANGSGVERVETHMMHIRKQTSYSYQLEAHEEIQIYICTKSTDEASFSIVLDKNTPVVKGISVVSANREPTEVSLTTEQKLSTPGLYKIKGESHSGMLKSNNFVVVIKVFSKK
eukprot:CAMPEP_0197832262 /NCGR_PEP_ID=MMETSP1437-20131217/13961_1 /TAXON_ID=49252 ORGANISM="Eucampia antarctica, Strain CCMP1452" /NCGR_SAMPLE_ID=MMETSP1437 /ASSEMBLY_ACC=CAM_ASM_001096 /LENGTH=439 /DNA_ID=CAMNT_0043435543 /DNA_START=74 /DNA_END=1393 /DNA_ORIENTATION=+